MLRLSDALAALHPRVHQRREDRRHPHAMEATALDLVQQVQGCHGIFVRLAGRTDDQGAHREPILPVQNFETVEDDVWPVLDVERQCFAGHDLPGDAHRTRLDSNQWRQRSMFRMCADRLEPNRTPIKQHGTQLRDQVRIDQRGRDRGVGQRDLLDAGIVDDAAVEVE